MRTTRPSLHVCVADEGIESDIVVYRDKVINTHPHVVAGVAGTRVPGRREGGGFPGSAVADSAGLGHPLGKVY